MYSTLCEEDNVKPINEDTSIEELESMGKKQGARYPVFIFDDTYGGRGLNFRAPGNPHGITMLILGTFPDRTTRLQTLMRVGRYTDKCHRIQDTKFADVDFT